MTLVELVSDDAVKTFLRSNGNALITFSAHWCGPCKASKPALEQLATKYESSTGASVKFGIAYEDVLGESIHNYSIRAFPTYVLFAKGAEVTRVEGANLAAVEDMVRDVKTPTMEGGETLGGGNGTAVALSTEEARAARLAKLSGSGRPVTTTQATEPVAMDLAKDSAEITPGADLDTSMDETAAATASAPTTGASDATTGTADGDGNGNGVDTVEHMDVDEETKEAPPEDPTANLNTAFIQTLTEEMGFPLIRAQKGLLYGNGGTVEGAVEWLTEHQDDADIDEANIALVKATSYKCNDCGKILSSMANLELHANKTGHSDFEESLHRVEPLTAEQKAAKIAEIKQLLKIKRAEREEVEKVDDVAREIQRRSMGKEMAKTKEQLDADQRKRENYLRKKEKADFNKERQRLREELARDKAERVSGKGKLSSRLGVDGYKPDGIQYDVPGNAAESVAHPDATVENEQRTLKKPKAGDLAKIDEYITKISSYRAGGDGGKCLKVLKAYVGNAFDNPTEEKYRSINMDNNAYKTRVKPFIGAKNLLLAIGFAPADSGDVLVLNPEADVSVLGDVKAKLEVAMISYG